MLRAARIIERASERFGGDAVERTMASSVSHEDYRTTMRTLRTMARSLRGDQPQR